MLSFKNVVFVVIWLLYVGSESLKQQECFQILNVGINQDLREIWESLALLENTCQIIACLYIPLLVFYKSSINYICVC